MNRKSKKIQALTLRRKTIIFWIAAVLLVVSSVLAVYIQSGRDSGGIQVIYTDDGFQPRVSQVSQHASVEFVNESSVDFWPASDTHPGHYIYPEFDAGRGMPPGDRWRFTFDQAGSFRFHDHLHAEYGGVIHARSTDISSLFRVLMEHLLPPPSEKELLRMMKDKVKECESESASHMSFVGCLPEYVSVFAGDWGVDVAVRMIDQLHRVGDITLDTCHIMVDYVGEEAYWMREYGNRFEFSDTYHICNNGFLHGFMSEHISHGQGDIEKSEEFCRQFIDNELNYEQCIIGVGNGASYFYWDVFGDDPATIIEYALVLCDQLQIHRESCAFGAFSGVDHMLFGLHGAALTLDSEDPFSLCRLQEEYQRFCYERMMPSLMMQLSYDPENIRPYLSQIEDGDVRGASAYRIGQIWADKQFYSGSTDISPPITRCRALEDYDHVYCVRGVFTAINNNSSTLFQDIYSTYCEDDVLNEDERQACRYEKDVYDKN